MSAPFRPTRPIRFALCSLLALGACNSTGPDEGEVVVPPPPPPAVIEANWTTVATAQRANIGKEVQYRCPANGSLAAAIYGTDVYTDDSAICVAAVHAGLIGPAMGGNVTITIRAGYGNYVATTRSGVTSHSYASWGGSYSFGPINPASVTSTTTAAAHRGKNNQVMPMSCPASGTVHSVWGTDTYTDDSSVCTAAVHAGVIELAKGGIVMVKIMSGRTSYSGSTRNGVRSNAYGSWLGSFGFR